LEKLVVAKFGGSATGVDGEFVPETVGRIKGKENH
jgi:hypothetical protein